MSENEESNRMRKMLIVAGALAAALCGCATVEQEAASYAAQDAADCIDYGARPGTSAYYSCRERKSEIHVANAQLLAMRRQRVFENMEEFGAAIYAASSR
jgi:hypothetical protein